MRTLLATLTATSLLPFIPNLASAELRPLAADRPDATESPQTVDKGHVQIESSLLAYRFNDANGTKNIRWSALETNIKYGVSDNIDLQVVLTPYIDNVTKTNGNENSIRSSGDIQIRSKINLWGNDSSESAMALLPYFKVHNGRLSNKEFESGVIMTYGTNISDYGVGLQLQGDYLYNETQNQHDWVWSHTAVLGYDVNSRIEGYVEYIGEVDLKNNYLPYASLGFTWQTSANFQWDIGSKFGLASKAQDFAAFSGFTSRF